MKVIIADNYEMMSEQAALCVNGLMQTRQSPLLCTASGDTPAGLYKALINLLYKNKQDVSTWNFIGLDEWCGMNGNDNGSCRFYLDEQLFDPLKVINDCIFFFDGRAVDQQKECEKAEAFIEAQQGLDIAILGLGMNGHIGMNEPGTSARLHSHITRLDPVTQKTGQKYFKEPTLLTSGITLGMATIMAAKDIILLVSGRHKAEIVKSVLEEEVSEQLPASLLRNHPGLTVFLDKEAASLTHSLNL